MRSSNLTYERQMIARAIQAYARRCAAKGWVYQQPNSGYSRVEGDVVILENVRGELARYQIHGDNDYHVRLRWIEGRYMNKYPRPARYGGYRQPGTDTSVFGRRAQESER